MFTGRERCFRIQDIQDPFVNLQFFRILVMAFTGGKGCGFRILEIPRAFLFSIWSIVFSFPYTLAFSFLLY
jgi:hypothetical protein